MAEASAPSDAAVCVHSNLFWYEGKKIEHDVSSFIAACMFCLVRCTPMFVVDAGHAQAGVRERTEMWSFRSMAY